MDERIRVENTQNKYFSDLHDSSASSFVGILRKGDKSESVRRGEGEQDTKRYFKHFSI